MAEDLLRRYKNDHNQTPPTVVELRQLLDKALKREPVPKLKPQPEPKPLDLFGFLDGLLEEYKTKLNERTAKPITATSRRVYQQTVRVLKEFKATHYKNRPFSFEQMDYYFYTQFQQYLIKRNYATNTIGKHLRTLKTFFIEARERGLMPQFSTKRFKAIREQTSVIYLNESELNTLFELDLSHNTRLEKVRDLFLVGCWTGLRFSDCTNITPENIDGQFIEITTQKTGEIVVIPIHQQVATIMERYKGKTPNSLPKPMSN